MLEAGSLDIGFYRLPIGAHSKPSRPFALDPPRSVLGFESSTRFGVFGLEARFPKTGHRSAERKSDLHYNRSISIAQVSKVRSEAGPFANFNQ
jgi:hypothetical protein